MRRRSRRPCRAQPTHRREGISPWALHEGGVDCPPSQAAQPQRDPALQSGALTGKEHSAKSLLAPQETQQGGAQCTEPGRGRDSSHKPSSTQDPPREAGEGAPSRGPPQAQSRPGPTTRGRRDRAKPRTPGELTKTRANQGEAPLSEPWFTLCRERSRTSTHFLRAAGGP